MVVHIYFEFDSTSFWVKGELHKPGVIELIINQRVFNQKH
jgi:hypothetical protein